MVELDCFRHMRSQSVCAVQITQSVEHCLAIASRLLPRFDRMLKFGRGTQAAKPAAKNIECKHPIENSNTKIGPHQTIR